MNTERFEDYYELLGVSRYATTEEIKKARRKLCKKYHPDLVQDDDLMQRIYGEKFAKINNATDVLSDPAKRAAYDMKYDQHTSQGSAYGQEQYEQSWYEYDFNRQSGTSKQRGTSEGRYEQRRTTSGSQDSRKHTTAGKHAKYAKKASFFGDLKQAYKEVLEDEKKARKGAARAHRNVNDLFDEKFGKPETVPEKIIINLSKGTLHIFVSTVRELSKIRYITKDSVPKFVIRTRRGLATGLVAVMIFSGLGSLGKDASEVPTPDTTITMGVTNEDDTTIADSDLDIMFEDEVKNTTCTINRTHTVEYGDTLSGIAEETGISMSTIQRVNGIESANLIRIGDKLTIPYTYNTEDMEYFTTVISVQTGTTVKTIADLYNTDVATIITLNEDAIVQEDNKYYIISDTIRIPNFATQKDVQAAKAAFEAYTKQQ